MRTSRLLPTLSLLVLCAQAPAVHAAFETPGPGRLVEDPVPDDDRSRAIAAIDAGDFRSAREILAGLIRDENVAEAERLVAAGHALDALDLLDEALELFPRDARLLHFRGGAAYAAASEPGASNPGFFFEDALTFYREALDRGYGVAGWFDASRAARRVPNPALALELVREGVARLEEMEAPPTIEPPPERTWAEASFDVFREQFGAQEDYQAAFEETERLLGAVLGRTPEDPWPRAQLSNLYQWVGDDARAVEQVQLALEVAPEDQGLHDRLLSIAPASLGLAPLAEYYGKFTTLHPGSARAWRNRGVAEFYRALEQFEGGAGDATSFAGAEERFARARAIDAAWTQDCLGYEVVCRNAIGWCRYNAGELSAAKEAFLSMEELFEGGLRWGLGDRLPDGLIGLGFVVQGLIGDPNAIEALDEFVEAAAIADYLHLYSPEDGDVANNAGFVNRDAAVLFERKSRRTRSAAEQEADPARREALEREAAQQLARAQEVMERSYAAYEVAAAVLSDNVRVINDTGLVMAYYLRTDVDAAERYLLRAVELGAEQLAADDALAGDDPRKLSEDDRFKLNEAWGDAHQNLGLLELTIRRRGKEAREWLAKSFEIGPPSREPLRPLLAVCDAMAAGEDVDLARAIGGMVWLHNPRR